MRFAFLALIYSLVSTATASAQVAPPDVMTGAKFLWHVAHCDSADRVRDFKVENVTVDLDAPSRGALQTVLTDLKEIRDDLEPKVIFVKQKYFQGEQFVTYAINSKSEGYRFFELRLLGQNRPLRIKGLTAMTSREAFDALVPNEAITIPQKDRRPD